VLQPVAVVVALLGFRCCLPAGAGGGLIHRPSLLGLHCAGSAVRWVPPLDSGVWWKTSISCC
jgi:hypothetical protein